MRYKRPKFIEKLNDLQQNDPVECARLTKAELAALIGTNGFQIIRSILMEIEEQSIVSMQTSIDGKSAEFHLGRLNAVETIRENIVGILGLQPDDMLEEAQDSIEAFQSGFLVDKE